MRRYHRYFSYMGIVLMFYGIFALTIHTNLYNTVSMNGHNLDEDVSYTGRELQNAENGLFQRARNSHIANVSSGVYTNRTNNQIIHILPTRMNLTAQNLSSSVIIQQKRTSNRTNNQIIPTRMNLTAQNLSGSGIIQQNRTSILTAGVAKPSNRTSNQTKHFNDTSISKSIKNETGDDMENGEKPLLYVFTAFIHGRPFSDEIHLRTLKNWGSLSSLVKPVLFLDSNDTHWKKLAQNNGWETKEISSYHKNQPVFRHMFKKLEDETDATFFGYANDDILFDETIIGTLKYLQTAVRNLDHRDLMVVGRRRDYIINGNDNVPVGGDPSLLQVSGPDAIDYIIVANAGFSWDEIPNIVIGGTGFTNYILAKALELNYIVLEVTSSVNAIHQTDERDRQVWVRGGNYSNDPNIALMKENNEQYEEILERGQTLCVAFISICRKWTGEKAKTNTGCNFALAKRKKLPLYCKYKNPHSHDQARGGRKKNVHVRHRSRIEEYDTFEGELQQWSFY